jgi:hypothetical protein
VDLERISIGNGGWVRLHLDGRTPKPFALVRFRESSGRLTVAALYLEGPIRNGVLKYLSVTALEDVANLPGIAESIRNRAEVVSIDLGRAARYYATTPVPEIPENPTGSKDRGSSYELGPVDCRLDVPTEGTYPDSFYQAVAKVYEALVARREAYAPAIAKANSVETTTVHRWVREARHRKILGPPRGRGVAGTGK